MTTNGTDAANADTTAATAAECSKCVMPAWCQPTATGYRTGLMVKNSLTRNKDEFLTQTGTKQVTWYMYVIVEWPLHYLYSMADGWIELE
jgi:hypothetical protein